MTNDKLKEFFATHEWFDNSRIKMIRGCKRKAFFQLVGPRGVPLESTVGPGANFGSAFHAGLARYYNGWGKFDESIRRVHACRAFAEEWGLYFPIDRMQSKHSLDRGLTILDAYCDHYLAEDALYEPVEAELGFVVKMTPAQPSTNEDWAYEARQADLARPFWYIGRIDGIFRRRSTGELFLRETKTTSSQADARLRQLKFDHQPIGYTYCARQRSGEFANIAGFMGDVILVAASKLEFARDYFNVTNRQAESWRQQLINTVEDWRELKAKALIENRVRYSPVVKTDVAVVQDMEITPVWDTNHFYQDTERCFEYGRCAFYDLCDYGLSDDNVDQFGPASWNPLLQRAPANIEIVEEPTSTILTRNDLRRN